MPCVSDPDSPIVLHSPRHWVAPVWSLQQHSFSFNNLTAIHVPVLTTLGNLIWLSVFFFPTLRLQISCFFYVMSANIHVAMHTHLLGVYLELLFVHVLRYPVCQVHVSEYAVYVPRVGPPVLRSAVPQLLLHNAGKCVHGKYRSRSELFVAAVAVTVRGQGRHFCT